MLSSVDTVLASTAGRWNPGRTAVMTRSRSVAARIAAESDQASRLGASVPLRSLRYSSGTSVVWKPSRSAVTDTSRMYSQVAAIRPSSRTLRRNPPYTGVQYPRSMAMVRSFGSDQRECAVEVGDEVGGILDPDRQADGVQRDARRRP